MSRSRDLTESRDRSRRSNRDVRRRRERLRLRSRIRCRDGSRRSVVEPRLASEWRDGLAALVEVLEYLSLALLAAADAGFRPFSMASASSKSNSGFIRALAASSSPSFRSICRAASSNDFSSTGAGVGSFEAVDFSRFTSRSRGDMPRSGR
jgi:hypothetical protein